MRNLSEESVGHQTYNRTMLELKWGITEGKGLLWVPYNRTMLELKLGSFEQMTILCPLIIVQCLNWNIILGLCIYMGGYLIIVQCLNWNSYYDPSVTTSTGL